MAFRGRIQLLCLGRKTACPGPTRCEYALKADSLAAQLDPYEYAQSVAAQAGSPPFRRTAPGVPANWGKTHFDVARPSCTKKDIRRAEVRNAGSPLGFSNRAVWASFMEFWQDGEEAPGRLG